MQGGRHPSSQVYATCREWLVLLICLVAFSPLSRANNFIQLPPGADAPYLHQIWRTEDGLPSPSVRAIRQSHDGYLWLGADEGIATFDGVRFREMEPRSGSDRPDRWLVALEESRDGSIWTSSINGGLTRVKNGKITRYTTAEGLLHNYILSLREDRNGNLWVGTAKGLCRFRDGKFESYTNHPGLPVEAVRCILEDRQGDLWFGTTRGLSRLHSDEFTLFTREDLLVNDAVMTLMEDKRGDLWIGTSQGLTHLAQGQPRHYRTRDGLAHGTVRALLEDKAGNIWVGSQGRLQIIRDGKFEEVRLREETLPDFEGISFVYALCEDHEGDIWVGSSLGLSRLKPQKFKAYAKQEGLTHNLATLVQADREGTVWVGTYGGGICRLYGGNKMLVYNTSNGLSSDFVLAFFEDRQRNIWFGTDGGGLNRLANGQLTHFKVEGDMPANTMRVIHEDRDGTLWIGSNSGAFRFKDGVFTKEEKIPRSTIRAIIEDRDGNLWFATKNGLAKWKNKLQRVYHTREGFPSESIATVFEDSDGQIWAATDAGGVHRLNSDGRFSPSPSGFDERVMHIIEDDAGTFWLATRNGIFGARKQQLNEAVSRKDVRVDFVFYGRKDGMRRAQCNGIAQPAGTKTADGQIWFPTMHGAVAFDPARLANNKVPPPVVIEGMSVDGRMVELDKTLDFAPGRGQVEIHYTALSFQMPDLVRFEYKLEGFDSRWEDAGNRRVARYASLPPGDYRFVVRACNNDGVWNETGVAVKFSLQRHFYQTYAFYSLCFVGLAGAGLGLHRLRILKMKQREVELEALVERRTDRLKELVKSMESFNYSIAHDLRAPMRSIRGLTEALVQDYKPSFDEIGLDYAKRIEQSVIRMDRLIEDLLTYGQISHKDVPLEHVNVAIVIEKVLQLIGAEIEARKAIVLTRQPLPTLSANTIVLEQVFLNLIGNALKFIAPGTVPQIEIWAEDKGPVVRLCVRDNGIGIKPEHQERIFRIFERLHNGQTYPGTGIGLAIVHRGVERLGGKVGVESEPDKGSCFWLELPKAS